MGTKFYTARGIYNSSIRILLQNLRPFFVILFLICSSFLGFSQTTSLSFTQIPAASPDLIAPGRGAEQWIGRTWDNGLGGGIMVPAGNANGLNAYYRFLWGSDIETAQGVYNWTKFDAQINAAIDAGKMFSFGLMPMCTACGVGAVSYPAYLHTLMQAEATNSQDWLNSDGNWVPNWNSTNYLGRYQALLNAVAAHIASGTHSGKNYKDVIYYVDIRGYGDFGEWHTYPWYGTEPAGRTATSATLKSLIDMNLAAFPNYPNVILAGAYDGGDASLTPADVTYYALTKTNAWGQIGWRRDNWGDPGTKVMLDQNGGSYNPGSGSVAFAPLIMSKYMYAPVVGEPDLDQTAITGTCGSMQCDLANEIKLYHATSFGDGNFPNTFDVPTQNNVIAASKASGYRLVLTGGTMTTTLSSGGPFNISLNWQNIGIAPVYENWNTTYELRKSDGTVVWTGTSLFKPKFFLPQPASNQTSDNLTLSTVAAGTYSMYLIIRDPLGFKKPLPLGITGVNADGSYLLRNNVTVGTGTANQPPVASAGSNQTITLPTSTATLSGSGTDVDGTIASYAWTKVSGPSGGTISNPTASSTLVTGLVQGVYVFSLMVTDNGGATNSASVQITVNASGTIPPPFTVNAGPDQTLAAGVTTTTLSGTIPVSTSGTPSDTLNLIVIQGESNAAGNANNSSANAAELAPRPGVQILNHVTSKFENLQIGVNNEQDTYFDNTHHGLELALADEIDSGHLKNPTYLCKIGISGSYVEEWLPNNTTPYQLWNGWIGYLDAAVAQMKTLGKPFRIIFWQSLGLNDRYGQGTDPATFVSKMATIRANFRSRYGGNYPFLSTDFNNPPAQTFDWTTLWTQMAASDPMFFSIPVTGATYVDAGVHFDYAGFKLIAHNMVNVMNSLGEGPSSGTGTGVTYTSTWSKVSGPTGGTIVSPSNANTNITGLTPGVYIYRLSVTSSTGTTVTDDVQITVTPPAVPPNQPPVASAGADQTITLPVSTATLNGSGSSDPDGTIASYLWTKISGPTQYTIANGASVSTAVSNLTAGTYSFQLKVTDNSGATALDTIKIVVNAAPVNQPPVAKAGPDQDITLPTNSVNLNGSASSDPDGSISSYLWTKISGPAQFSIGNSTAALTTVSNLTAGVYSFQLKVTDNAGAIALDTIKVIVNAAPVNQPPVANAGGDIVITLPTNVANLNGTASSDPDGSITVYAWTQVSGPSTATIATPSGASTAVSSLQQGTYIFSLKVTDNSGASDLDSVKVTVNAAANQPPVANAGSSKTITLPVNSTNLNGSLSSDPDGTIAGYSWIQISGPSTSSITNGNIAIATASNLVAGVYTFQLTVTDNSGATAIASVKITVNSAVGPGPQPPVANAGANITITLPTNSVTIDGSGSSAPSGNIVSYVWSEKSGPSQISLSNIAQNTLNNLQAGVYIFYLTVTDNNGATASDSVIVTVNPAANKAPVANAGSGANLILPNNTANLDGSKSYDPDGTIVSYSWTEISGPNTPTEIGANTAILIVSNLVAGQYTYQLTVTDNDGATASAQVKIKVSAATNIPPVANAGSNLSITEPTNSVNLNGNGSYDPDGTIALYSWVVISGPGSISILNSTSAQPTAINLQTGIYTFELTVTDNNGATASDDVTVTVLPKPVLPNQPPIANAGTNVTITAPASSVTLDGSSSFDPDGTISDYSWKQISGPSTAGIQAANNVTTAVSQLLVGQYVFALTVTDNNGATATDQVTVTVNPGVSKVNLPPVADAGSNDTIVMPNNTYVLNGSQSMDPDGTIESYQWHQISGPNTVNNSSMDNVQVTINDLQVGQYEFQLTVTDNSGVTSTSTMTLTVEPGTGVQDKFIVFPNPAHDVIHGKLTSSINGTVKIYIYDVSGQLVLTTEVEKSNAVIYETMSVAGLASGMYTVQINIANRKIMVTKFIKE
jgi:ribosomal protein L14